MPRAGAEFMAEPPSRPHRRGVRHIAVYHSNCNIGQFQIQFVVVFVYCRCASYAILEQPFLLFQEVEMEILFS